MKALVWFVWLAQNDLIFNANDVPVHTLTIKIDRLLLSWFSNCAEGTKGKLEEAMGSVRRSLEFLGPRSKVGSECSLAEEAPVSQTA